MAAKTLRTENKRVVMLTGSEGRRGIVRAANLPWLLMNSSFDEAEAAAKFGAGGTGAGGVDTAKIGAGVIDSVRRAADYCAYLSTAKNLGAALVLKGAVAITADTVVFNKKLLEKPKNEAEVYEMILGLNGAPHEVITAVTISGAGARKRLPDGISKFGNEIFNYYIGQSGGAIYLSDVPNREGISSYLSGAPETDESGASFFKAPTAGERNATYDFDTVTFAAVSKVLLSGATRGLIKQTIEKENPYACSGGYTIDGILKPCFKILSGTEENIIGLPLQEILQVLR